MEILLRLSHDFCSIYNVSINEIIRKIYTITMYNSNNYCTHLLVWKNAGQLSYTSYFLQIL